MKRIVIVGTSGSGKSVLARTLSDRLGVKYIWLDEIGWLPDWKMRERVQFREIIDKQTEADYWVVDGNYGVLRDIIWPKATDIIWLNYSFSLTFWRCFKRTVRRSWNKTKLFNGENRESFFQAFFTSHSILIWVFKTYWMHRREYPKLFKSEKYSHINLIELHNQKETDRYLLNLLKRKGV